MRRQMHPLQVSRASRTTTLPLEEALRSLNSVLQTAELGMVVTAPTRFGKSAFIDEVEARFKKAKSGVVMRSTMTAGNDGPNWENKFHRRLRGEEEGEESVFPHQSPKMALLRHIENECDKVGSALVVFPLDEAQNLSAAQLDALKTLSENLLNIGLKPFFLLVGQPELLRLRNWLREHSRYDIVQRFMLQTCVLRGMRSAEDVSGLLRHTDKAVWPAGSTRTYTAHFAPVAWSRGWRIEREADRLWRAFVKHAGRLGVSPESVEVGTQFVAQAQLALLQAVGAERTDGDTLRPMQPSEEMLRLAVEKSGFRESLNLSARPEEAESPDSKATRKWLKASRHR